MPDDERTGSDEHGGYRILVSGGSMGGLFTGHALRDRGHDVTVFEQSTGALSERGAGIVAQPHVRELLERYAGTDPDNVCTSAARRHYLDPGGNVEQAYDNETSFTSWDAVYARLRAAFPDERYEMGRRVVGDDVVGDGVRAQFDDGDEVAGDLLVAAEGWQSATRERHLPHTTTEYAGYVAWRGVVAEDALPEGLGAEFDDTFVFFDGSGELVLAYFIPGTDGSVEPGGRRLNWVWYDWVPESELDDVLTDAQGRRREGSAPPGLLRETYRDRLRRRTANHPPQFTRLVRATDDPFVQPIVDLTVPEMTFGRTCLLGDAAFVARPHTAAGTEKAARDALALAESFDTKPDVPSALAAYESSQRPYGQHLVERGREMGMERLE